MRLRDLDDAAAVVVEDLDFVAAEDRDDERVPFGCTVGEAASEEPDEALDAIESRAFEAAALRGGILSVRACMCKRDGSEGFLSVSMVAGQVVRLQG